MKKKLRSAFLLESLEARLLFSADLALLPLDGGTSGTEFESSLEISLRPDSIGLQEADTNIQERREVIFVDEAVDDFDQLIADLESQLEKGRQFNIVTLDSGDDGITQISAYLGQQEGIDAVHVISHGSDGAVKLGNVWLTPDTLDAYADAIEGWQWALSSDADLLFYGCNLAAGNDGQELVNSLTLLTGADVAASDDVTGSAQLGGDWVLEYRKGEIETAAAINNEIQQNWNGVLASFTVDTTADTVDANPGDGVAEDASGDTSLRAAIMEANALAGADSVYLSADTYGITRIGLGDSTGDLDIRDDLSIVGESPATTVITGNNGYRVFEVHNDAAITVSFENLKILDGQTGAGGPNGAGLLINGGATMPEVYVSNVWLSGNNSDTAGGMGGAIANSANLTITNSLIEGNDADEGGGVWNQPSGFLSMVNVTISGNNATDGDGGGFFNEGTATLRHVTITNNTASATGGGLIHDNFAVSTDIGNSIIAGNTAGSKPDVSSTIGTITSSGGNIVQDATGASGFGAPEIGIYPLLGGLNNNGGNLMTHEPSAPQAIDSAIRALSPTTDQRGFLRGDGNPDIGAYEASSDSTMTAHYLDQFNAIAYNGNDGTLSWTNVWQEIGESNGAGTGAVSVWDELGEDGLYLWGANNVGAWRQADLSGATQAALSFNWAMTKTESGDQAVLQISTDGVVWTTLDTFDGPLDHTSMQSVSYDISAYIDSDTRIRFETVSGFADNDVFFVDNVSIVLRTSPPVVANLSPVKDTWITINNPIDNFGADAVIRMDEKGSGLGEGHVLLQFDLSSIPAGATITSAVLQMEAVNKSNSGSSTINVYEVTEAWDEGSGGNNDATWNNRQTGVPWGTLGGSVNPPSVASLTTSATGGHTWDITALMQDWQSGDKINNGMMLVGEDLGDVIFDYDSREGSTPPKLVITYSVPYNNEQVLAVNTGTTVDEGSTGNTITAAMLETTDIENTPAQLVYTVTTAPSPAIGTLRLGSTALAVTDTFTQADINAGQLTYDHNGTENFTDSFAFDVDDGAGATSSGTFSITVTPVNDNDPVADDESFTVAEGGTATEADLDVGTNLLDGDTDTDLPNDTLTVNTTPMAGPSHASSFNLNADGTFSYTHDGSENFSDSFTYEVLDADGGLTDTGTVTITVTPVNDNEQVLATNTGLTVNEGDTGTLITQTMLETTDIENTPAQLVYTVTTAPSPAIGTLRLGSTALAVTDTFTQADINAGQLTYDHNGTENFTDSFAFDVDDGAGATSSGTFSITVTPVNDNDPVADDESFTVAEGGTATEADLDVGTNLLDGDTDTDLPNDTLTVNTTPMAGPSHASSFNLNADGTFSYTHDGSENFSDSFTYEVLDADGGLTDTGTVTITVTPVNDNEQVLATNTGLTVNEGDTGTLITQTMLETTDIENTPAQLVYTVTTAPSPAIGTLRLGSTALAVTDTFTQADINAGQLTYDHNGTENFTDSFAFDVDDGAGATSSGTFSITVTPVNDNDPVADDESFTVAEGGTATEADLDVGTNLLDGDTDTDLPNDTLTVNTTPMAGPSHASSFNLNADGTFSYTHDGSENFSDSFTYEVLDADGGLTDTGTVTITVTPVNDNEQVLATNTGLTVNEGDTGTLITQTMLETTDIENTPAQLVYTVTTAPSPAIGTLRLGSTALAVTDTFTQADINAGQLTYDHNGTENFTDSFAFDVDDGAGATSSGTFSITVTPVNDNDPVADDESFTVAEGGTATEADLDVGTNLLDGDTDTDLPNDTLTVNTTPMAGPSHASSFNLNADGTFSYTHDGSENFSDSFTYEVLDADGGLTDTGTVTITVTPVNDNEQVLATNTGLTVNEGDTGTLITQTMLETTDIENTPAQLVYTVTTAPSPAIGTLRLGSTALAVTDTFTQADINAGQLTYDHNGTENFTDSFAFDVDDGAGATSSGTFSITVTPVNDNDPVADDESFTVAEGGTATEADLDVGTNLLDGDTDTDLPNDTLTVNTTPMAGPSHASSFNLNADGTFSYTHDGSENFSDSFTYEVLDADGGLTDTGTVTITVTPVNDNEQVLATNTGLTVNEGDTGTLITQTMLETTDIENTPAQLVYTVTTAPSPAIGTLRLGSTALAVTDTFTQADINAGQLTYDHNGTENFTDSFAFDVDDGAGATSSGTFSITVTPVNDNDPVADDESFTVAEGGTATEADLDVGTNLLDGDTDTDLPNDTLTVNTTPMAGPSHASSFNLNADGTFSYTHDGSENFSDSFTYEVLDADGGLTDTGTVTITVTPVNDNEQVLATNTGLTVNEGDTGTLITQTMLETTDIENTPAQLVYTVTTAPSPAIGTLRLGSTALAVTDTFTQADINAGQLTYDHNGTENFTDSFAFDVDDGAGATSSGTFSITVTPVNDNDPVADDESFTVAEGGTATEADLDVGTNLLDGDTDTDLPNDTLTVNTTPMAGPSHASSFNLNADGTFSYTHDGSENFSDSFTYEVLDADGGLTDTGTVTITVTPVNDNEQVLATNTGLTVNEGDTGTLITQTMLETTDIENTPAQLVYTVTTAPSPAIGTLRLGSTALAVTDTFTQADINAGQLTYDHNGTENFTDSFAFDVDDGAGATSSGTFSITVTPVNDAPTGSVTIDNMSPARGDMLTASNTLADADGLSGPISYQWQRDGVDIASATATTYTTTQADVGAVITVTADYTDDLSTAESLTGAPTMAVTNINDPGTVTIDNTTPTQGDTLTANVIDPDGASGAISFQWFSDGVAIGGATGKTYTTAQADVGTTITITAVYTDDLGTAENLTSAPTAPVTNLNEAPVAVNDNLNATEDQSMTLNSVTDLLGNDTDMDGDTLTISGFTQPANGTLADNGDGSFTYTPLGNFNGNDSFTYTISDGKGETATGTAIIVVTPVGDTPQVTNVSTNDGTQSELIFINRSPNDAAEVTHFKISGITNGTLYLADGVTRIDNGDFITVEQGQAGLKFTPAGDSSADGSFNVESSENGVSVASQSGIAASNVTVMTPAPAPPEPKQGPPTLDPEQIVSEEVVEAEEESEDVEDVADEADVQADADNRVSVETPQPSKVSGTAKSSFNPGIAFLKRADSDSDDDKTPDRSTRLSPQTLKMLIETDNLGELKAALKKLGITTISPEEYELVRGSLDAIKDEMGKEILLGKTVLGSAIATSVGLSAGYVVWMLKGGSLLASLLSSLPAWQLADPLAILVGKKEDEDDDDDSLKTIIEEGSGRDEDKENTASELDNLKKESTKR